MMKNTRPKPFVGLPFFVPDFGNNWFIVYSVNTNTYRVKKAGSNMILSSGFGSGCWDEHHTIFLSDELWPGEPGCPPVPEELQQSFKKGQYVYYYSSSLGAWHKGIVTKDIEKGGSYISPQIRIGSPPPSPPVTSPTTNKHSCPVCGSRGTDMVVAFYCTKIGCQNYKKE